MSWVRAGYVFPALDRPAFFWYQLFMAKAISGARKRGRGRPPVGAKPVNVRFPPTEMKALDVWIKAHPAPRPTRPEAIRRLVEYAIVMAPAGKLPKS